VAFSLAAFRQAFAGGRDLSELDTILIAAAACEMHPTAVIKALELQSVSAALERATKRAIDAGVRRVPAVVLQAQVFEGDRGLDLAAGAST
jgi:2-hydroxychromene-2-carboxylate isomerase